MKTAVLAAMLVVSVAGGAAAQKGAGDPAGVARGPLPDVVPIAGIVVDAKIARCPNTTGRADVGAHIFVEGADGQRSNVHLGPVAAVDSLLDRLPDGTEVSARVFRTDALPPDHYVAVDVTVDGETVRLRDDGLRPAWAIGPGRSGQGQGGQPRRAWQAEGPGGCWWIEPEPGS
jgi:hypothetical protein